MQVSLDGFIEGPDGDMSWVAKNDEDLWEDLFDMLREVDLLLLGRKMFPDYRDYWKACLNNPDASAYERKYATYAKENHHIIFSNTLKKAEWDNTTIMAGNVIEHVKQIKNEAGRSIQIVGGARMAATLIDAGLVDHYRLVINPCIVNSGKSFFQQLTSGQSLQLLRSKTVKSGHVILDYASRHESLV